MVLPVQEVFGTQADFPEIFNFSVPADSAKTWNSAAGSVAWDRQAAQNGALGEALERYAASVANLELKSLPELQNQAVILPGEFAWFSPDQYGQKDFLWPESIPGKLKYAQAFSVYNNKPAWLPDFALTLGSQAGTFLPSTSTGLAAHNNFYLALLSALEEVLERDALACFWQNCLGGRSLPIPEKYQALVNEKGGEIFVFDLSQAWNPLPVVAVCGFLPSQGKKRISLGVACRPDFEQAVDKAFLEFVQGCIFAGFYIDSNKVSEKLKPSQVTSFDLHAAYYTIRPQEWDKTPLMQKKLVYRPKPDIISASLEPKEILAAVLPKLKSTGLRLFYRQLAGVDLRETGLYVIRVVCPELSLIHGDERTPFLGGRIQDVVWRYPDLAGQAGQFPNPFPHPLG